MKYARWIILAGMAAFTSCQIAQHEAHSGANKWEKDTLLTLGGSTHTTGADGFSNTTDHNASFQVGAQAAGVAVTGIVGYLTQKSADLTTQLANAQAGSTARAQISANLQATLKQLDAQLASQGLTNQANHFQTAVNAGLFTASPLPTHK